MKQYRLGFWVSEMLVVHWPACLSLSQLSFAMLRNRLDYNGVATRRMGWRVNQNGFDMQNLLSTTA